MKPILKKSAKTILKISLFIAILVLLSVIAMLILQAFGIIFYNEEGMQINHDLFESFKTSWYGWIIIISLQVIITMALSFVPGTSMAFIILIQSLYEAAWQAYLIAFAGVMLTSLIMYMAGRLGGYTVCKKMLGEKDCQRASDLLNHKGVIFFPLMMLFPVFPDDALVMIAGTLKMSLKWFIPSIVIGRGIGIATIVFGLNFLPFDKFTSPWHWILFILICAILIGLVFFAAIKFNKYLEKRKDNSK